MGHIISVHSYRGGTGKSNIAANLAWLTAKRGHRVAVLDTDLQSPGVHLLFGLEQERMPFTLSDFLFDKCELEDAVYEVSPATAATRADRQRGPGVGRSRSARSGGRSAGARAEHDRDRPLRRPVCSWATSSRPSH